MKISTQTFGATKNGKEVSIFTLENENQTIVKITNYGAIITDIQTPDKKGDLDHIVLGFDKFEDYVSQEYIDGCPYFGAVCGRVANRIKEGTFSIDNTEYKLAINNGPNALHGGIIGFDKVVWDATTEEMEEAVSVKLNYLSVDGEEGYPGNMKVEVTYTLTKNNDLLVKYNATTDQKTIVNLTNHTYFNLNGANDTIKDHDVVMNAQAITPVTENLIPTGDYLDVTETPFDFTEKKSLGLQIDELPDGYDVNFVLNKEKDAEFAGTLSHQATGRSVSVFTTQPGMQIYTGYYIPEFTGHDNKKYGRYMGVALETQHFPDSVNQPNFPSVVLEPGQTFEELTRFHFETK
ncbi:galactose mutarotase [Halosquirtibacter xylanolyticus]|uniref:aldose epimerase family protein n=1 Tax=Halosquirtibacter xylanolyticus TaxID=3374599 RepID=UPI0037481639|nr:galactose mutarotase [Prolixibacteraceae bacterium]